MRIQLAFLTILCFMSVAFAQDDKAMNELFQKYDQVMDYKKTDMIDDIFTAKFIKESGGKQELIEKIKELPTPKNKKASTSKTTWRKGLKGDMYFAKLKEVSSNKKDSHEAEFVVIKENGKLKIDGTLSDGD